MTDKPEVIICRCCNSASLDWEQNWCVNASMIAKEHSYQFSFYQSHCGKCDTHHVWVDSVMLFIDSSELAVLDARLPGDVRVFCELATNQFALSKSNEAFAGATIVGLDVLCTRFVAKSGKAIRDSAEYLLTLQYPEPPDNSKDPQQIRTIVDARIRLTNLIFRQTLVRE